jgi:hypothetical protein
MILFSSCYPLNTILVDREKLDNYLATHNNAFESSDDESDSDSDENGSSSSVRNLNEFTECS